MSGSSSARIRARTRLDSPAGTEPLGERFLQLCACAFAVLSSFYLPLSAAPVHAAQAMGPATAGMVTGLLMAGTIAGESLAVALMARLGRRSAAGLSLAALALPSFAAFDDRMGVVAVACLARGFGLGVILVAAGSLAATLPPPSRRGEALGIYGFAAAAPAIVFVPLGLWVQSRWGASPVAAAAAVSGLLAFLALGIFPQREPEATRPSERADWRPQVWPAATLVAGAMMAGAVVTFLPLMGKALSAPLIATAMLLHGLAAAIARLASGRHADRRGPRGLILLGLVATLAGALALGVWDGALAALGGTVLLGAGFGLLQNGSLRLMLDRAGPQQADAVSMAWNIAYDAGLGLGGVGFGLLGARFGYDSAFVLAGLLAALLIAPLWIGRAHK